MLFVCEPGFLNELERVVDHVEAAIDASGLVVDPRHLVEAEDDVGVAAELRSGLVEIASLDEIVAGALFQEPNLELVSWLGLGRNAQALPL